MSPSDSDLDPAVLSQEELALLDKVSKSEIWRLIRDALCLEREYLFSGNSSIDGLEGQPTTTEALWKQRGAILLVQHLLQEGPRFVIWYRRYLSDKAATPPKTTRRRKQSPVKAAERVYDARDGAPEGPDFGDEL